MILWLAIGALASAAAAVLLLPLFRQRREEAARGAYDMEVYRDQLDEVGRDRERGLLGEEEEEAARTEIERRLLAAVATPRERTPGRRSAKRGARLALAAAAVLGPVAALGLYLELGEPGIPGQPFADRAAAGGEGGAGTIGGPQIEAMVAQLAARLEEAPDDLQGWTMLGRSYAVLERFSEAAEAYARAFALDDADPAVAAAYGEALMRANNGTVTAEARTAFAAVLAADPKEPQARFFLGLAKVQEGRPREGLEAWEALVADSPPDAPWLAALENEISQLKQSLGEGR